MSFIDFILCYFLFLKILNLLSKSLYVKTLKTDFNEKINKFMVRLIDGVSNGWGSSDLHQT